MSHPQFSQRFRRHLGKFRLELSLVIILGFLLVLLLLMQRP
jgi:hypothetical protein